MAEGYDHLKIEKKWQEKWAKEETYKIPGKGEGENYYFLTEFPYPSGNLHVGHWYAFSVPDIFVRYMRARGHNVLYPIGFDAFGLPAENAAIQRKLNPRVWTFDNIEYMRGQLRSMGASFDWSREVITADPAYYKWTQWLFLQFFNKGLVYRKETPVNWCPKDKTVLANEQVVNGVCERCGTEVVQKMMPQWNIKITDYADRLIDNLKSLEWPKQIKDAQINWIGRSEGAEIDFPLTDGEKLTVFTTRPDTLFGATYMVVAPEHLLVSKYADANVTSYVEKASKKTERERTENKEKTGVELKGVRAINLATKEEIPIFAADYVLSTYGTGAIMAVPAHDERDFEFAKKFNIPIRSVIEPTLVQTTGSSAFHQDESFVDSFGIIAIIKHWSEEKYLALGWREAKDWGTLLTGGIDEGMSAEETVRKEIKEETGFHIKNLTQLTTIHSKYYHVPKKLNRFGHAPTFYIELEEGQDEISGEEKEKHELHWLSLAELKKFLTAASHLQAVDLFQTGIYTGPGLLANSEGFNGLANEEAKKKITEAVGGRIAKQYHLRDWVVSRQRYWGVPIPMIHCEVCGYNPVPEKDLPVVLPEIDDYLPRDDGKSPLAKATSWVQVACPKCGKDAQRETDTLDTFVDSSWYFQRYTDPHNENEFASKEKLETWMPVDFYSGGSEHTTMHLLYSRFWHKAMFDLGLVNESEPYTRRMNRGLIMGPDGQKMSKSKGNVIDPDEVVKNLGADTVRMYLAFIGPYNEVGAYPWNPGGAVGVRRFLERVWSIEINEDAPVAESLFHQTIKKVGEDIESLKMNTAVSQLMILLNAFDKGMPKKIYEPFLKLLQPFAPHIASELAEKNSVSLSGWPTFDPDKLKETSVNVAVQVNGKVRATVLLAANTSESEALELGRKAVEKWLDGGEKKAVYVAGKIVNFVV